MHNIRDGVMEFVVQEIPLALNADSAGNSYHAPLVSVAPVPVNVFREISGVHHENRDRYAREMND